MEDRTFKAKLVRYIDAGFPIIYINTFEEDKVDSLIPEISSGKEVYEWNETNGYIDFETKAPLQEDCSFERMLDQLKVPDLLDRKILVFKDITPYLDEPRIVSKIKGLARMINQGVDATVIIVSSVLVIPKDIEKYVTILEMDYLNTEEIKAVINSFVKENLNQQVEACLVEEFALAFKGLTEFEILNLLALSYADDGELTRKDLRLIFDQKQQMIKKAGILEMIPLKETIDDIGGLENLKAWFIKKAKVYKNMDNAKKYGVDMPKGVLIAGVPGCGKSLNAKAAANLFEVPLLRLDMGRLMGKYVGESEGNLRSAIALAEAISPCVLWIDELEKAFAGIGGSGGGAEVTTRLFGNFLTWMQEKESPTFVVATANDITQLPPELLRKGRFDEIFYVGLPNKEEREKIFNIHIRKRRPQDLKNIRVKDLVSITEGFSGADIEGVVKDAIESAFAEDKVSIQTADVIDAIKDTHSLSEIMKDALEKMTKEYESRKFKSASK
ncbi:AAA family ATPase [Phascolarctobacterium succinatutens]|uniref:AAA family ATPase n=1 Tax=Phascolarctobacterium succinatutens TaxID=626940 RepID=UPI0026EEFD26|nr:AAA family ATPase [Phascolarctobacterium succinatutens]